MDPLLEKAFDLRLQLPGHSLFVGMSMSGKTRLVLHLLRNIHTFTPVPRYVLFLFDQFQEEYEAIKSHLQKQGIEMQLRQGANITLDEIEKREHHSLIIIDDATEETASSSDIAKITTNGRHKNVSLWLIWHSLYTKHAASRLIAQNVSYIFFLPSVRLISQLHILDSQLRMNGALVSAYKQVMSADEHPDHRYLLLDLSQLTPSMFRLRSDVTETAQTVFLIN